MVPAWVMIIFWVYFELLVITRTDKPRLVPSNGIVFFSCEKKISQILEISARKWNTLERNGLDTVATWLKQKESITLNSNFS